MVSTRTLIGALAAAAFCVPASAQSTKWDMPTPYSDGEFHTRNVRQFAEDVKKETNGALEITVHSNQSLIKHPDILRAVSTGQVNIGEFLLGQFGNEDPVFAADNVPFVAPGYDNAMKFYNAQKPVLEKKLQGRGIKLLYAVAWPGQGLYTKDPVKSVSDLKGQKMRTYSPLTSRLAELLGCTSVQVQVSDVPQMFATGAMQAMVTSSATGTATKAWEFVKNYTKTNAWNPKNVIVVNERAFARLPKNQQDALVKAAAAAEPRGWEMSKAREKEGDDTLAKNGVAVSDASPELRSALSKLGEQMAAEWEKSAGADGQAILKAYKGK
ncbi:MAG TPA: TRAP transporter substrate-binding protein [Burkholderiales bacterium]|nr:TRAP transporter substrate-binding protein [Burkholderiales bacterium]